MKVRISFDGQSWDFVASDLGPDLLLKLLLVATEFRVGVKERASAGKIEMYGEPEGMTLWINEEDGSIILRLFHIANFAKGELGQRLGTIVSSELEFQDT